MAKNFESSRHNKPFEPTPGIAGRFLMSRGGAAQRQRWISKHVTLDQFRAIKEQGRWGSYAALLLSEQKLAPDAKEQFGTYWVEAGHHIREQIADDRVLVRLLRHILPPYEGEAIELFRGENRNRWKSGVVGLAWTASGETARMFGRGLNAVGSGGVLLKARFEPEAIISGPNGHSRYLGEGQFTVDPGTCQQV